MERAPSPIRILSELAIVPESGSSKHAGETPNESLRT